MHGVGVLDGMSGINNKFSGLGSGVNAADGGEVIARNRFEQSVSLQAVSQPPTTQHVSMLASAAGVTPTDYVRANPELSIDTRGYVVGRTSVYDNGGAGGGGALLGSRDVRLRHPTDAAVVNPTMRNLGVVNVNGVQTLRGTVQIVFHSASGEPISDADKYRIMNGLGLVNQASGSYAIDLKFSEVLPGDTINNRSNAVLVVTMDTEKNTSRICGGDGAIACLGNDGRVRLPFGASSVTAAHEFMHRIGLGHNSRAGSLMYDADNYGPRTLSDNELRNVINAYL